MDGWDGFGKCVKLGAVWMEQGEFGGLLPWL
jgi:hypothetical protein